MPWLRAYKCSIHSHTGLILVVEAEKRKKENAVRELATFWKYLEPILNSGKPGSTLFQLARLHHLVKESAYPLDWSHSDMVVSNPYIFWFVLSK